MNNSNSVVVTPKVVKFEDEAQEAMYTGISLLARAVGCTMGHYGRVVTSSRLEGQFPLITKDGVSVANEICWSDQFQNLGAQLLKSVAAKANADVGDGTTTATVLADELLKHGFEYLSTANMKGATPVQLKLGANHALEIVRKRLKEIACECTDQMVYDVALISSNGDKAIAKLCSEAVNSVGAEGVVNVNKSLDYEDRFELSQGLVYEAQLVNLNWRDEDDAQVRATIDKPLILTIDDGLKSGSPYARMVIDMLTLMTNPAGRYANRPVLIVCNDFDNGFANMVMRFRQSGAKHNLVKMTGFGEHRTGLLNDLAKITGGVCLGGSNPTGIAENPESMLNCLGEGERAVITLKRLQIVHKEDAETLAIKEGISTSLLELAKGEGMSDFRRGRIQLRQSIIGSGIGEIELVGKNELDYLERYHRLEDALNACRAAKSGGVIGGGGSVLHNLSVELLAKLDKDELDLVNPRHAAGARMLLEAIRRPFKQILVNAWVDSEMASDLVREEFEKSGNYHLGYDVATEKVVDLFEAKVYDPINVTLSSLDNSMNVAILVLTSGASITFERNLTTAIM